MSVNGDETEIFWIISHVGIDEASVIVFRDKFCKFGRQLQDKQQVWRLTKLILSTGFHIKSGSSQATGNPLQNVPGNSVVFSIGVAISNNQNLCHSDYLV